jgi:hypothetical protein
MPSIIGVATVYMLIGGPLFCGGIYDINSKPWVALDINQYLNGSARCGDIILLQFPHRKYILARAMDAGPLRGFHVEQWGPIPIIVDVPEHIKTFKGISSPVKMYNITAGCRNGYGLCE